MTCDGSAGRAGCSSAGQWAGRVVCSLCCFEADWEGRSNTKRPSREISKHDTNTFGESVLLQLIYFSRFTKFVLAQAEKSLKAPQWHRWIEQICVHSLMLLLCLHRFSLYLCECCFVSDSLCLRRSRRSLFVRLLGHPAQLSSASHSFTHPIESTRLVSCSLDSIAGQVCRHGD